MPDANQLTDPKNWMWLLEIAIVITVVIALSFILRKVVHYLQKKWKHKEENWQRKIQKIMHMPLQIAMWGAGIAYAIELFCNHFGLKEIVKYVQPVRTAFIVGCLSWIALRWVKVSFKALSKKSERMGVKPGTVHALSKLVSFVLSILILMIILQIFGVSVVPLLAFGGIGMAGVAFASQDIIANFFGGAMLHLTRSFSVGDMIVVPSQNNFEGVVTEIGWYITVVEDYYRRPTYFPNAMFSKLYVINESKRSHRRIRETVAIRYEDLPNITKIIEGMKETITAHPDIDDTTSFSINFNKFGTNGPEIFLYILTYELGWIRFLAIKQEVFLRIQDVMNKYNAEFCYPTTTVHLNEPLSHKEF